MLSISLLEVVENFNFFSVYFFQDILADKSVYKVGVGVGNDCKYLLDDHQLEVSLLLLFIFQINTVCRERKIALPIQKC